MKLRSAVIVCSLVSFPAWSQVSIEEIQVSVQKREQNLLKVPTSLSVYSQDSLNNLLVDDLVGIAAHTPGVTAQAQSVSIPTLVIRGISSDEGAAQDSPRISILLNNADISRNRGSMFELYDLERVEVARGPNAALFGNSSTAGALHAITKAPEQTNSGRLAFQAGSYGLNRIEGFANFESDQVRARIAFLSNQRQGYVEDIGSTENLMGIDRWSIRPSLSWDISDTVRADLVTTFESADDSGVAYKSGVIRPADGDLDYFSAAHLGGGSTSDLNIGSKGLGTTRDTSDYNLQLNWQISDNLSARSITHYRDFDSLEIADSDGSQAWALHIAESAIGSQWSQEFQLNYAGDGLNLVAGLSYSEEDNSQEVLSSVDEGTFLLCVPLARQLLPRIDPTNIYGLVDTPCQNADQSINSLSPLLSFAVLGSPVAELAYNTALTNYGDNERWSAYFDASLDISETLTLYAGFRYIEENLASGFEADVPNSPILGLPLVLLADTGGSRVSAGRKDDDFVPRVALQWQISEFHSAYLSWAEGRKSGVTSVITQLDPTFVPLNPVSQIPPETLANREIGIKGLNADQSFSYGLSMFWQEYSDFQIDQLNSSGQFVVTNAGRATNKGVEVESSYQLNSRFLIRASGALIDAEIDEGSFQGQRFRMQPERSYSMALVYNRPIDSAFSINANLNYRYQSGVFFDDALQPAEPFSGLDLTQGGYGIADASLGIVNNSKGWSATLWTRNALDKDYLLDAGNGGAGFGLPTFIPGSPRMSGFSFALDF